MYKRQPDVLVLMSNQACEKYISEASDPSTIIIDSSLVNNVPENYRHVYPVPAPDIAEKELGARVTTNGFMLSAVAAVSYTHLVRTDWAQPSSQEHLQRHGYCRKHFDLHGDHHRQI